MKKLMNLCIAFFLAMGIVGCSNNTNDPMQAGSAAVSGYIECIRDGDLEGMLDHVTSEDVDPLDLVGSDSVDELLGADLGEAVNKEAEDFRKSALKNAVTSYTITGTELNDGAVTVTVDMTIRDYGSIDLIPIQAEIRPQIDNFYIENQDRLLEIYLEQGEEAMTQVVMQEMASYLYGVMETALEEADEVPVVMEFTVEEIDGEWLITGAQEITE